MLVTKNPVKLFIMILSKHLEMKLFIPVFLLFCGTILKGQVLNYDANRGLFEMSFKDTVLVSEKAPGASSFKNLGYLNKGTENCTFTKLRSGSLKLTVSTDKCKIGSNVHILVKYTDGKMGDSKNNSDLSSDDGHFIHFNISKPIEKIRLSSDNGYIYDFTGFKETNKMLKDFTSMNYKELNDKYSQSTDIYEGF